MTNLLKFVFLVTMVASITGCDKAKHIFSSKKDIPAKISEQTSVNTNHIDLFHGNVQGKVVNPAGVTITNAVVHIGERTIQPVNYWFVFDLPKPAVVTIMAPRYQPWVGILMPNSNDFNVKLRPAR